jgi:putative ABC transport system permease protein
MIPDLVNIAARSIKFYTKPVFYQVIIIALLSAVITGSLLTGRSVKESLKKSAAGRLGNTGVLISSGERFINSELAKRIKAGSGINCIGIIELNGYCQGLDSQKKAFNTHIFGVSSDFFPFQGHDNIHIRQGEVAVNKRLAEYLGIKAGEDLIIRFKNISDIPSDAPFASGGDAGRSVVLTVGTILEPEMSGNFSLSISQITPFNIFVNPEDLQEDHNIQGKANRLLVNSNNLKPLPILSEVLEKELIPSDIGLKIRLNEKAGCYEIISDRIFIDEATVKEITMLIPSSAPLLTYLGNNFENGSHSTPYSFISALPSSLYPEIAEGNGIIINRWMSQDLSVNEGDTIKMYWYSPDSLNKLIEKNGRFIIKKIVDMNGTLSDSLLMPDFPGISGKASCSDWDAGVLIKMNQIRTKDEGYWKRYRGTPKAFINYETGIKLWGNNFGPATAIRFPAGITEMDIKNKLSGFLNPFKAGLSLTDLYGESVKAANQGVDFSTLFLSLGFFLILASIVLLSFATSSYINTKKRQVNTLFALGFKKRWINKLLFLELGVISFTGCIAGAFAGYPVDAVITRALNTVWNGAVQTDTLKAYFDITSIISGFILTLLLILIIMWVKVKLCLKALFRRGESAFSKPSKTGNLFLLIMFGAVTSSLFALSILLKDSRLLLSFVSGTLLLITSILFWRQLYLARISNSIVSLKGTRDMSNSYYSINPSGAVTPILFIAAGIFALFITGANRMNFNEKQLRRSGGTGGYLLWCESTIPIKEDLNTETGRKTLGLDDDQLKDMNFINMKRSSGNDASCLNLNHISIPPLLGVDPSKFISEKSFSFSKVLGSAHVSDPWEFLKFSPEKNTIYGIADQTVLEWGLKLKPGDTLVLRAENGQPLNIIIAAGLQSSVFQGNVLIGLDNFSKYYPSVSGSSVFLVDGNKSLTDLYKNSLNEKLENYGEDSEKTVDRLASFYKVTNTYLSVFGVFGALGMITGVAGLGFVLLRNYNQRKQEFALMLAIGFNIKKIRLMLLSEQLLILFAGIISGIIPAIAATLPSIKSSPDIPWTFMIVMIVLIVLTGMTAILVSIRSITVNSLVTSLKRE